MMMTMDDYEETEGPTKTIHSEWNVKGLKEQVNRLIIRSHKKIGKASARVEKARKPSHEDHNNMNVLHGELEELQTRLQGLNLLMQFLGKIPSGKDAVLPLEAAQLAVDLGVDDKPPSLAPRGPKKQKGPRTKNPPKTRLPYRRFYSLDNTEIRVRTRSKVLPWAASSACFTAALVIIHC
jgi:hypothetical protein